MAQPGMENKRDACQLRIGETILMVRMAGARPTPLRGFCSLSIVVPDEQKAESLFNALRTAAR